MSDHGTTVRGERHPEPRRDLVAHIRHKIELGQYRSERLLALVARSVERRLRDDVLGRSTSGEGA